MSVKILKVFFFQNCNDVQQSFFSTEMSQGVAEPCVNFRASTSVSRVIPRRIKTNTTQGQLTKEKVTDMLQGSSMLICCYFRPNDGSHKQS